MVSSKFEAGRGFRAKYGLGFTQNPQTLNPKHISVDAWPKLSAEIAWLCPSVRVKKTLNSRTSSKARNPQALP